jgi:ETC complex I subunit conserved region
MSIRQDRTTEALSGEAILAMLAGAMPQSPPVPEPMPLTPTRFPPDASAIIYRPAKSAMTSGRANTCHWVLEFRPRSRAFIDPLMGWVGGNDPLHHVQLRFPTLESAVAYAEREGLPFSVRRSGEPNPAQCAAATEEPTAMPEFHADPLLHFAWDRPYLVMPDIEQALLDPAGTFASPMDVARHPLLSEAEKRQILQNWLWDAQRIDATAAEAPLDGGESSRFDEVLQALAWLDRQTRSANGEAGRMTEASLQAA